MSGTRGTVRADKSNLSGYVAYRFVAIGEEGDVAGVSDPIYTSEGLAIQEGTAFLSAYNRGKLLRQPKESAGCVPA